jgi:hypothetical protein
MVLLLPSEPVTVTPVALVAVTVKVEVPPAATVVGLAVIVTAAGLLPAPTDPHPVTSRNREQVIAIAMSDSSERNREMRRGRETRTFTMELSFLLQVSELRLNEKLQAQRLKEYKASSIAEGRPQSIQDDTCFNKLTTFAAAAYLFFFGSLWRVWVGNLYPTNSTSALNQHNLHGDGLSR